MSAASSTRRSSPPASPVAQAGSAPADVRGPMGGGRRTPWRSSVFTAISWALLALMIALAGAVVAVPLISGAKPFTVLTGSMEPTYPPGTLVVARETSADGLRVGDVITFQLRSGEPRVATHRIVGIGADADGDPLFVTRGDANDLPDADPVRPVQIVGKLWYAVPYVGWVNNVINGTARAWIVPMAALALIAYGGVMVAQALRERRARRVGSLGQ